MSEFIEDLNGGIPGEIREEESGTRWNPDNDQGAEWCIQQIRNAEAEKQKWKEFYDAQYQKVADTCDLTISNMEAMLQTYFEIVPHNVTKTQETYQLPSGRLILKKQGPEFQRDDEKVIAWLEASGMKQFIKEKTVISLDWAGLKKACSIIGDCLISEDGEVIPDVKVIQRPDIFKVER